MDPYEVKEFLESCDRGSQLENEGGGLRLEQLNLSL